MRFDKCHFGVYNMTEYSVFIVYEAFIVNLSIKCFLFFDRRADL